MDATIKPQGENGCYYKAGHTWSLKALCHTSTCKLLTGVDACKQKTIVLIENGYLHLVIQHMINFIQSTSKGKSVILLF